MKGINQTDTVAAIATAGGSAAIAMIRLSGPKAFTIAGNLFAPKKGKQKPLATLKSHTLHFGNIVSGEEIIDEVLLAVLKAPHTYTGEDTVEISCHGSQYIQQKILQLCLAAGARLAAPGEFTLRAFLNGKMDLAQAEAVADLIASDSASTHRLALQQMRGGFSEEIKALRGELIHLASLIELELDFAEEDVEFANRGHLRETVERMLVMINRLIISFELGNVIRAGIPVVIAGKPNAGKSTLLNTLLNEDRAIVSEVAGTTRDTIEEEIVLDGIKFRFIDTAGIRETHDAIEKIGVSKTFEKMNASPVVLYVFDVTTTTPGQLEDELARLKEKLDEKVTILPVGNKVDALKTNGRTDSMKYISSTLLLSAREKTNLDALRKYLLDMYKGGILPANNNIVTSARHVQALKQTAEALKRVYEGLLGELSNDLIATNLRHAMNYLGEITGEIATEDLLENIFSKFCIGK